MGTSGWDDDTRGRGRSSRDARPREGERSSGRSNEGGGYSSGELRDARGRSRSRDDGWGDSDRSRSYPGRGERSSERDYNRVPGNSGSRNPRPSRDDNYGDYSGRSGRDGRDGRPSRESRGGTSGLDRGDWTERSGERSMRGQRPPQRGDMWDSQQRRGPAGSGTRSGSSGRGGLWDDDPEMRGRRPARAGGSDPRGRSVGGGRPNPRDPRALRRGVVSEQEAEETKGVGCSQAILIVFVLFVLGSGLGFAAFKLTAPKVSVDNAAPPASNSSTPATTPSVTPKASPSATPKADVSPVWLASSAPYGI